MKLYEAKLQGRNFHLYVIKNQSPEIEAKELLSDARQITMAKFFRMIKTSLDMKFEVLVFDHFSFQERYSELHRHHYKISSNHYLYLNISIKNKIVTFFDETNLVTDFHSLESNNKLLNFFSN